MSGLIANRFTPSAFDKAHSVSIAEGTRLTARIHCSGRAYKAELVWKSGWERTEKVITAFDEASMRRAILTRDPTARFIGKINPNTVPVETVADKNAEMLEAMRLDTATVSDKAYISACQRLRVKPQPRNTPAQTRAAQTGPVLSAADQRTLEAMRVDLTVSAQAYRNACAKFGVQPQPRPTQAATPTSQTLVPFHIQGEAYGAFMQAHGELFTGFFAEGNAAIIAQWMQDNNRQCDTPSLDQCYRECKAAGFFRTATTLTRDLNGSLQIVQPYSHERIVAARRQQTTDAVNAPPDYLSDVEKDAWRAVRQKYPTLSVPSAGFQTCVRDTILKWSREFVLEQQPELGAANKKGELSVAITKVLNNWAKLSNPNINKRVDEKGNERIWLGTIWL